MHVPRVWCRVVVKIRHDGALTMAVQDDTGLRVTAPQSGDTRRGWHEDWLTLSGLPVPVRVQWPDELATALVGASERLESLRSASPYPAVVPLLVKAPRELALVHWQEGLEDLMGEDLGTRGLGRWLAVGDRPRTGGDVPAFELPLRLLLIGEAGYEVQERCLADGNPWVDQQGVTTATSVTTWVESAREAAAHMQEGDVDIIVADAADASRLKLRPKLVRPARLAIVLGSGDGGPTEGAALALSWCRSLLLAPGPAAPSRLQAVSEMLFGLSHDLPLHDAVTWAADLSGGRLRLSASAESLHDLRLTSAWEAIERETTSLQGLLGAADLSSVIEGAAPWKPAVEWVSRVRTLEGPSPGIPFEVLPDPEESLLPNLGNVRIGFAMEREGLLPLAGAKARLGRVRDLVRDMTAAEPTLRARGPADADRVVNLGVRRSSTAVAPGATAVYADQRSVLAADRSYTLDVQVGSPWQHTLMKGWVEPIGLLLPDSRRGHDLTVSIFSDTFVLDGLTTLALHLPPEGASEMVSFAIRTPAQPGYAWLRVSVYHQDNLLQTFRLTAVVADDERYEERDALVAELEHSATTGWRNLDALGRRDLSVTLNHGTWGHRVFIKHRAVTGIATLDNEALDKFAQRIRENLALLVDGAVEPADAVWELANLGRDLHVAVFAELGPQPRQALEDVRNGSDLDVQVVRTHVQTALPWPLSYDWPLPTRIVGEPRPPVCLGRLPDGQPCTHTAADEVVCVRGFWGLRHQVEEILADPEGREAAGPIDVGQGGALLALGVQDPYVAELDSEVERLLDPATIRRLGGTDRFLDEAFQPSHAGVVVVLGHYEREPVEGQPQGDRISIGTLERWLLPVDILQSAGIGWGAPRPLVLLLACGSTAVRPRELTSFLSALHGACAGGIVGTECDIFTDLARDFTAALLGAMRGEPGGTGMNFSRAVLTARRELVLGKGDVRGLVFDAYGPAELAFA